jgi:hypothetical protein
MEDIIKTVHEELGCFNSLHKAQEREPAGRSFEHGHDHVFSSSFWGGVVQANHQSVSQE